MLNKLKFNTLSLSFLFLMFVLAWGTTTAFATETNIYNPSSVMTANGERVESDVIDFETTIDVKCVEKKGTLLEYRIYFYISEIPFIFWIDITVSNNTITHISGVATTNNGCRVYYFRQPQIPSQSVELSFEIQCGGGCCIENKIYRVAKTVTIINNHPYVY